MTWPNVEQQPNVSFGWNTSHTNLDGDRQPRARTATTRGAVFGTLGKVNVNNLGLFFQDAWTVNNRLTINAGVRTEREDVPSYRPNLNGIKFSFGDKLAPRVGVAYDLKGDGKWKAFGSWGVFYDTMKLELPRGSFGGDVWIEHYYNARHARLEHRSASTAYSRAQFLEDVDFRIPSNDPACPECGAIDPNLKPFRQQELVGGIEHELTARMAVSRPLRPQAGRPRHRGRRRDRSGSRRSLLHRQSW